MLFAGEPLLFIPPEKGKRHLLRMIREILIAKPENPRTSIANTCHSLIRALHRKSLIFFISDFFSDPLDKPLGMLARQHETVAIRIFDPLESKLPNVGRVVMIDSESGLETIVNTSNANLRMGYEKLMRRQREGAASIFKKHGIQHADLTTNGNTLTALHKLLKSRSRRRLR
jgi:uncharacterized protein (DUF58 family)